MKLIHTLILTSLGGFAVVWSGCSTPRDSTLVTAPPPAAPTAAHSSGQAPAPTAVAVNTPANLPPGTNSYVVVQTPPAPLPPEAIPAQPSSQHVWLPGYWTWRNNRYEWMAGHWETPPRRGATWVNPRWSAENGAYRFYEGYWN